MPKRINRRTFMVGAAVGGAVALFWPKRVQQGGLVVPAGTITAHPGGLTAAIKKAKPGDTVLCDAGAKYTDAVKLTPPKGTLANPILIDCNGAELAGTFALTEPNYIVVKGGRFTNPTTSHQCKMDGGIGWTWTENEHPSGKGLSQLLISRGNNGAKDYVVSLCTFHDNTGTQANMCHHIYCSSGTSYDNAEGNGLIERCLFWNNNSGSAFKLGGGACDTGGAANVEVRYSTIYDSQDALLNVAWQSHDNDIHHNIAVKSAKTGAGGYHAHQLQGGGNRAHDNIGWDTLSKSPLSANTDKGACGTGGKSLVDDGGNLYLDPLFDKVNAIDGFHPLEPLALGAGRWAA